MADATSAQDFGNQRLVLVCVDAPERQAVIKAALDQLGFIMYVAKNVDDALERLRRAAEGEGR